MTQRLKINHERKKKVCQLAVLRNLKKMHTVSLFLCVYVRMCTIAVLASGSRDGNIMLWDSRVTQKGNYYFSYVLFI